jgi:GntR family transcriptional repressor for pyruvate dehydrogenase complex
MSPDMQITRLERRNVVDEVFSQIMLNINNGVWLEGDKLPSENELCKLFNVSRVSIRSTLQRLKDCGQIITKQGLGSFVADPNSKVLDTLQKSPMLISEQEYRDVVEFRKAMEFAALDLAVRLPGSDNLNPIKKALDDMSLYINNLEEYTRADYRFHKGIMMASGNQIFVSVIENIEDTFYRYLLSMSKASLNEFEYGLRNHKNIYRALAGKDAQEAKRIISKSMEYNIARFYREVKSL